MKKLTLNEAEKDILVYSLGTAIATGSLNNSEVEIAKILLIALNKL